MHQQYIPIGCLVSPIDEQEKLTRLCDELSSHEWIRIETIVSTDDDNIAITRIYFLPNDLDNGRVDRSNTALRRKRMDLLASLDYSAALWKGLSRNESFPSLSPDAQPIPADGEEETTLLKMFNTIPSPKPDITSIEDDLSREFMSNLLASTIDGLITDMYPYQCRSSALMHQKEVAPACYLDPRLIKVLDQEGSVYYYNSVTGDIFREPRYYDASPGGILAEEMGSGKTLICLALITATKTQPASAPDLYQGNNVTIRPRIGSLMDMAATIATKHALAWKSYIDPRHDNCIAAIQRNPGWYYVPRPQPRRLSRGPLKNLSPIKIYLSHATLVVVPANLLKQWVQEISKHTQGLQVCIIETKKETNLPLEMDLLQYDIILCSVQSLEVLWHNYRQPEHDGSWHLNCSLGRVRYKRCIVDEGHRLGNVRLSGTKTGLLLALDSLHIGARWIVTGTPSKGLFGVEEGSDKSRTTLAESTDKQERQDLERIGAIATFYLKSRPWSNTIHDCGDTPADWKVYVMQPKHSSQSSGRKDCLRSTFNSLIIRHQLSEVSHLLPNVDARVVKLEGSYQDKLSLNLFSMMIIFNAVQSQRTDQDYLFHPGNRKSLLQLVHNLRQASFFGGPFFSSGEIQKSVETALEFLDAQNVPVNEDDSALLKASITFGKMAAQNKIKEVANLFHEMPIYIKHFPGGTGSSWSMDQGDNVDLICTNWKFMMTAQKILRPFLDSPEDLNTYLNSGSLVMMGTVERDKELRPQDQAKTKAGTTLAGNTKLGEDHISPRKRHSASIKMKTSSRGMPTPSPTPDEAIAIAAPLADTQLVSTASAKLSYLIDAIIRHQKDEQIIVFYENENVAWYLAGILEMLQIQHLIYSKTITTERRAQYVSTFNHNRRFRVLLMEISQAAFGLDMRSASRIYFINPVPNPQVEAQAIGRVRRISQQKKVTVETLVLKDSLEEVIIERKQKMTQAEHRNCKTILDDGPIYEWILNPKILPLPNVDINNGPDQMAPLAIPQCIFGREFGRETSDPDEDILLEDPTTTDLSTNLPADDGNLGGSDPRTASRVKFGRLGKVRIQSPGIGVDSPGLGLQSRPIKRARFASGETGEASSRPNSPGSEPTAPAGSRFTKRARFADDLDSDASVDASTHASTPAARV